MTEAVRRHPYSVVLLDEIEKAHSDIFNLLLQTFDDGRLTDSQGRSVDFKNTIIIMTSNIGFNEMRSNGFLGFSDNNNIKKAQADKELVTKAVKEVFRPEFINRIDEIVIFNELIFTDVLKITEYMVSHIAERAESRNISVSFSDTAIEYLATIGFDLRYGVRNLKRTIVSEIENSLSHMVIEGIIKPDDSVNVDYDGHKITVAVNNVVVE